MRDFIMLALVACLGSDTYMVRERAHASLQVLVDVTDNIGPIELGLKHKNCEIRQRCRRIYSRYTAVYVPDDLSLWWFNEISYVNSDLYSEACAQPSGDDAREYVWLLVHKQKLRPWVVRALVTEAINKRAKATGQRPQYNLNYCCYRVQCVLERFVRGRR